ncbi:MAG: Crp/Fnr family transcriptional regulator [Tissierellia bacterium]|nr:Crp/Fnr family transcriptional regulator [Tissierellia bacterium]
MNINKNYACDKCGLCINKIEIFEDFDAVEQMSIASQAMHEFYKKGSIIFSPQDAANRIIIITKGKLKLSDYDDEGKEYIYDIATSGDIIGEETLFSDDSYGMFGEALTDINICILSSDSLEELIALDSDFRNKFIKSLGRKFMKQRQENKLLSIFDAKDRLYQFLLMRSRKVNSNVIELTRDNIASTINVSRETVSRKLKELEEEGTIELVGYKKIIIKK